MAAEDVGLKKRVDKLGEETAAVKVYVDGNYHPTVAPAVTSAKQGLERETPS